MNRARFVEPARLEVLAEAYCYHRVEAGLATKFLEAFEDAIARALAYPLEAAAGGAPGALRRGPSAHSQPLVALQAQAPGRMALHEGHRQGLARGVAPGRLQQ